MSKTRFSELKTWLGIDSTNASVYLSGSSFALPTRVTCRASGKPTGPTIDLLNDPSFFGLDHRVFGRDLKRLTFLQCAPKASTGIGAE
jgi:hypothetical protein